MSELHEFLSIQPIPSDHEDRLAVGIINAHQGAVPNSQLFDRLGQTLASQSGTTLVCTDAADGATLKSLLKAVNHNVTRNVVAEDDEDDGATPNKGPRLVNYDLRVLQKWCNARDVHHVVVGLPEAEGIDPSVLTSLITLLQ